MTGKYLITTEQWFYGVDGKQYRAAWGEVEIVEDSLIGVKTNRNSTNWYAKVGSKKNHIIIAGCQIHYAIKCDEKPNTGYVEDWKAPEGTISESVYKRPSSIYIAE